MILYDFWADWCGPCKMMNPVIEQFEKSFPDIQVIKIDMDNPGVYTDKAKDIRSVPTYILTDDAGEKSKVLIGAMPYNKFIKELGL